LARYAGTVKINFTDGAINLLNRYSWPGNVRELANAIERAVILAEENGSITQDTLSFLRTPSSGGSVDANFQLPPEGVCLDTLENDLVRQALEASGNNQTAAAKLLGLTRAKFRVLLKQAQRG
jgi:DNA-binding NtrC family response regulator